MYEEQYLHALMVNDITRLNAIERLNDPFPTTCYGGYYSESDRCRDRLTAIWGRAYEDSCID